MPFVGRVTHYVPPGLLAPQRSLTCGCGAGFTTYAANKTRCDACQKLATAKSVKRASEKQNRKNKALRAAKRAAKQAPC